MKTLFVGRKIIRLDRVDSTNNYTAATLRHSVMPEGAVVWAKEQFAGKGQRGKKWESEAYCNLTATFIFYPTFLTAVCQFDFSRAIALAVRDLIAQKTGKKTEVKWPNDVLVEGEKIAGILIENNLRGSYLQSAIAGIGINVNQEKYSSQFKATSLKSHSGKDWEVEELLFELCEFLEARYLQLKGSVNDLRKAYEKVLFAKGEWRKFQFKGQEMEGKILEVEATGLLVVEKKDGERLKCSLQEIVFIL